MPSSELATCGGCGLVCDDIELAGERLVRTCPLGEAWFVERLAPPPPLARVDGREVELDAALDAAAAILREARAPLVYGLGRTTCEAQRAAVALAEALGAAVELAGPRLDGASGLALQARGASTATLGDVRDRAEVVVIWRADPVTTHPRLLERLRLPAEGRELVVVDEQRTATAEAADTFIEIGDEVDALMRLRALVREPSAAGDAAGGTEAVSSADGAEGGASAGRAEGVSPAGGDAAARQEAPAAGDEPALRDLAARLRAAENVAVLHHVRGHVAALQLQALVRDLGRDTHAVSMTLRREANAAGAEDVLAWQTGYPAAVSFARGHPTERAGAVEAADAALVVSADPLADPPAVAAERLRAIPLIAITPIVTVTAEAARVAIAPAAAGLYRRGVVHRLDGVPVPLRAPLRSDRPGDDEVLTMLEERLR
jgi:formylmethanofuran dehydrogenase subunit B